MQNSSFIDRLIERLDRLDPASVQGYVLKLARTKGVLETILEAVREGILIIDRDLRIHFANQAAVELLGLPGEFRDLEKQQINRYLRGINWAHLIAGNAAEWERASRQEIEVFYPTHRHLQFYLLPYSGEVAPGAGNETGAMITVILQDVTEQRRQTEETIESERLNAITMLAAGVAHEIGNPLNSLTIHLQLLERYFKARGEDDDAREAAELTEISLREVRRLDTIITQFLRAVRPQPLERCPLSLKNVINDTLEFVKHEINDRGVFVEARWPEHVQPITGDETQLKQAVYNIVVNALQAMPDGGMLRIDLEQTDEAVVLNVHDTGKGIPKQELANVFTPYYTTRKEGTGLGLMIVQRIVRDHGATIGVSSEVGAGTTFSIRFPRRDRQVRLLESPAMTEPEERR